MKLLKLLVNEVSSKVKKQLLAKFSPETTDTPDMIIANIDLFDNYKSGLPLDKRDILKYTYDELKDVIETKKTVKGVDDIFTEFKKKESKLNNDDLRKNIKNFLEIQSELPKNKQDILKYKFLDLAKINNDLYTKLITQKLLKKFGVENTNLTQDQILFYISSYLENKDDFPSDTKRVDLMTFSEFEHTIDAILAKKGGDSSKKGTDLSNIDLRYDENNLKIFAPKTKDQCIKLRNNRTWCTSREGSSNLYYNYRLDHQRTLYYVIDEDKDFNDVNFAVVILVDPNGHMALADGSNAGRYSGHNNIPWSEIENKIPKLKGLKDIFVPEPLTPEEKELIRQVKNIRPGDNPIESFGSEQMTELWLEILSPRISDTQYTNLTPNLKKKYISLGLDLTSGMIKSSEPDVLKYYINKKIDGLKSTNVERLSAEDIALLNTPMLKKVKEELKTKFAKDLVSNTGASNKKVEIDYPNGSAAKFVGLYGFSELFESLPVDITGFLFNNKSNDSLNLEIPQSITRFQNLDALLLWNCVTSVPDEIGKLTNLQFLSLPNNKDLTELPKSLLNLPSLMFVNLKGSNPKLPEGFSEQFAEEEKGSGFYTKLF